MKLNNISPYLNLNKFCLKHGYTLFIASKILLGKTNIRIKESEQTSKKYHPDQSCIITKLQGKCDKSKSRGTKFKDKFIRIQYLYINTIMSHRSIVITLG